MRASDLVQLKDLPPYEIAVWTNNMGSDFVFFKLPEQDGHTKIMRILYVATDRQIQMMWGTYKDSWVCRRLGVSVEQKSLYGGGAE